MGGADHTAPGDVEDRSRGKVRGSTNVSYFC